MSSNLVRGIALDKLATSNWFIFFLPPFLHQNECIRSFFYIVIVESIRMRNSRRHSLLIERLIKGVKSVDQSLYVFLIILFSSLTIQRD